MNPMRTLAAVFCVFACLPASNAGAQGTDLSGAWANHEDVCAQVFVKRGNRISFTKDADSYGSGFIIEGNRIRGRIAACSIKSRKQDGAVLHLITTCSTDVALQNVQFSVKIEGANQLIRMFPGIPELDTPYFRCSL